MSLDYSHSKISQVYEGGAALEDAEVAVIFLHGKGGNAETMFNRAKNAAAGTDDVAYFAPESATKNWFWGDYTSADDPNMIDSIDAVSALIASINAAGIPTENIILAGYSQGAVIANEYIAQTGANLKEVFSFSGSLVTPIGEAEDSGDLLEYYNPDPYGDLNFNDHIPDEFNDADLTGQTITLTVHEIDRKAPLALTRATADHYRSKGAQVELHVEAGKSHAYTEYDKQQLSDAMRFNIDHASYVQTSLNNGGYVTAVEKVSRYDNSDSRITLKVFNEYGFTRIGQEVEIDTANGTFVSPSLATLGNGNFVLIYADDVTNTLLGKIYTQTGTLAQDNLLIAQNVNPDVKSEITIDSAGFDVSYKQANGSDASLSFDQNGTQNGTSGEEPVDLPMNGNGQDNLLAGDDGDNVMRGYGGNDEMSGLGGKDSMYGGGHNDTIHGNDGNDLIRGQAGNDFLYGNVGNDRLLGDGGDDALYGLEDNDLLRGGTGNDTLFGGDGNDTLKGEDGNDHLYGDAGKNKLIGGAGSDFFHFNGEASNNTINDFKTGIDVIVIESANIDDLSDLNIVGLNNGNTRITFEDTTILIKGAFHSSDIDIV